jgi:hypothetical protein
MRRPLVLPGWLALGGRRLVRTLGDDLRSSQAYVTAALERHLAGNSRNTRIATVQG